MTRQYWRIVHGPDLDESEVYVNRYSFRTMCDVREWTSDTSPSLHPFLLLFLLGKRPLPRARRSSYHISEWNSTQRSSSS